MRRFRSILVAATPGELDLSTLRRAVDLAVRSDAELRVLGIVEPLRPWQREVNIEGRIVDLEQLLCAEHRQSLARLVKRAGGDAAVVEVRTGKPADEVVRAVLAQDVDLVIVGEGVPDRQNLGLGTGVMQLLRACPVPVWVMRPTRARTLRILALVDPDPTDAIRDSLNGEVVELAKSLTSYYQGELHVGHSWEMSGEAAFRASPFLGLPDSQVDLMVAATRRAHQHQLEELTARHGLELLEDRVHLVRGESGIALPALARRIRANLLVMGTVARTGISGLIMGNTAESILRSVSCSVLAIKPEGFQTPVRLADRRSRRGS